MEELQPEELEELVQELAEEYRAPDSIPQRVRVCPECGRHNLENAWHCSECGETLSIETLTDKESAQRNLEERRSVAQRVQQQPSLLAPSELVLLHGDKFANTSSAAVKFGEWVDLLHLDAAADAKELGVTMLAVGFLTNEQAGAVRLAVRQEKALFSLLRWDEMYVEPGEHAVSWPTNSFESRLQPLARRLQSQGGKVSNQVYKIVSHWLGGKYPSPWEEVGNRVRAGLARRGLLETQRNAGLGGFLLGESFVLPAETAAWATQQSLEPIEQLLETCMHTRPEVWRLLIDGINRGVSDCRDWRDEAEVISSIWD